MEGGLYMKFEGIYSQLLSRYIEFKRNLGYKFFDAEYTYSLFDRFTIEYGETQIGITRKLAESWAKKRLNESDSTRYRRVMYLIHFSAFLNDMGYASHIPPYPNSYKSTFVPYIFTRREMDALFHACDKLEQGSLMDSTVNVIPAMIRLMYGTGIRVGEAVNLKVKDVNLKEQFFVILNSKNGKERLVPFTGTVADACSQYRKSLTAEPEQDDYFFVKRNGRKCRPKTIYEWFRKALRNAGISHGGKGQGPRLHDLRHTFAVHSMAAMAESGLDLYYSLPVLSEYLGHQALEATDKYVRLTSEMYPGLLNDTNAICSYAFPELVTNEGD
jgi:integrase/recombinase XerD